MKNLNMLILVILVMVTASGCADAVQLKNCLPGVEPSGFWHGVWHGAIMLPAFICSLFSDHVAIYDVNNTGAWYDFGFVGGLGIIIKGIKGVFSDTSTK